MLGAAFHGMFAAFSFPGDVRIFGAYLPSVSWWIWLQPTLSTANVRLRPATDTLVADCYVRRGPAAVVSGYVDLLCKGLRAA